MMNNFFQHSRTQGFTLVELLVAMFIFSLLSAFAFNSINLMSKAIDGVSQESAQVNNLQKAMLLFERDLNGTLAFLPGETGGVDNLTIKEILQLKHPTAGKTISYSMKEGTLFREIQYESASIKRSSMQLLEGLDMVVIEPLNKTNDSFDVRNLKLTITQKQLGSISRDFYLSSRQFDEGLINVKLVGALEDSIADAQASNPGAQAIW